MNSLVQKAYFYYQVLNGVLTAKLNCAHVLSIQRRNRKDLQYTYFRLLMAVLLKHHDLGHVALGLVEHGLLEAAGHKHALPRSIAEICKLVHQAKRALIKV